MEKLKNVSIALIGIIIFCLIIFRSCFTVNDKIGYNIGVNKAGRQIFIQSLNYLFEPEISVDSDFRDYNFLQRMWVQPMRTTLKLNLNDPDYEWDNSSISRFFSIPIDTIFKNNNSSFSLDEKREIPMLDLKEGLKSDSIFTVQQLLEGMGFEKVIFTNQSGQSIEKRIKGKSFRNLGIL